MKQRVICSVSILALASGVCGALYYRAHGPSVRALVLGTPAKTQAAPARPAPRKAARAISRAGWEPGVEYVHEFSYAMNVRAPGAAPDALGPPMLRVRGQCQSVVSEARGRERRVRLQLSNARVEAPQGGNLAALSAASSALGAAFFVDYDEHGKALRLLAPPKIDPFALDVLRELVSVMQFTAPIEPGARWNVLELDPTGEYQASYESFGASFERHKLRYTRVASPAGERSVQVVKPEIRAYAARFELDDWGRVARLEGRSTIAIPINAEQSVFQGDNEFRVQAVRRGRSSAVLPFSTAGLVETSLTSDSPSNPGNREDLDRALVDGASLTSLLEALAALSPDDAQPASVLRDRLAALFRLDRGAAERALGQLSPSNASVLLSALVAAGTPEAERSVGRVLGDNRRDLRERRAAADAIVNLEHPSQGTCRALEALLGSSDPALKQGASLALGVMASRVATDDPAQAQALVERLTREASAAQDSADRVTAIGALGNARSAQALPAISQALGSEDPALRSSAAVALRFVPDAGADALLAKAIAGDRDPSVRSAALTAAGYRDYAPFAETLSSSAKDPDPNLRGQVINALSQMASRDGQALVLLDWMAQHDPDGSLRDRASQALDAASATM